MLAVASKPSAAGSSPSRPLPLESGEFMHSSEFLRRYARMPQVKKAELIEGVVYCMGDLRDKRRAYCRNGVREYAGKVNANEKLLTNVEKRAEIFANDFLSANPKPQ